MQFFLRAPKKKKRKKIKGQLLKSKAESHAYWYSWLFSLTQENTADFSDISSSLFKTHIGFYVSRFWTLVETKTLLTITSKACCKNLPLFDLKYQSQVSFMFAKITNRSYNLVTLDNFVFRFSCNHSELDKADQTGYITL